MADERLGIDPRNSSSPTENATTGTSFSLESLIGEFFVKWDFESPLIVEITAVFCLRRRIS